MTNIFPLVRCHGRARLGEDTPLSFSLLLYWGQVFRNQLWLPRFYRGNRGIGDNFSSITAVAAVQGQGKTLLAGLGMGMIFCTHTVLYLKPGIYLQLLFRKKQNWNNMSMAANCGTSNQVRSSPGFYIQSKGSLNICVVQHSSIILIHSLMVNKFVARSIISQEWGDIESSC